MKTGHPSLGGRGHEESCSGVVLSEQKMNFETQRCKNDMVQFHICNLLNQKLSLGASNKGHAEQGWYRDKYHKRI